MSAWTQTKKVRDDDPYHAWAHDRRRAQSTAPGGLCQVLLRVNHQWPIKGAPADALTGFRQTFVGRGKLFQMAPLEVRHLNASIESLRASGQAEAPDYLCLYVAYAEEDALFADPRPSTYWEADAFAILQAGPAVGDDISPP